MFKHKKAARWTPVRSRLLHYLLAGKAKDAIAAWNLAR